MQWMAEKNAGFTTGTPWLMVNPNYTEINAAEQENRDDSVLNFYRKALKIRKEYIDVIRDGEFTPVDAENKNIFAYSRAVEGKKLLVACSLSPKTAVLRVPSEFLRKHSVVIANTENPPRVAAEVTLKPCECVVWEIKE